MSDESDSPAALRTGKDRLLVVEDEAVIRFVLRCELEQRGFEVVEVENGRAALQQFDSDPDGFSGAFIDYLLPDTRGDEIIEHILQRRPDFSVVLMTGDCDDLTERFANERGCPILRKPFPLDRVRPLLATMRGSKTTQEQPT